MDFFEQLSGQLEKDNRINNLGEFTKYYFPHFQVDPWIDNVFSQIDLKNKPDRKQIIYPAPRGHSKTTTLSLIYPLATYLRDTNARILIIRKSAGMAREIIKWLADTITTHERFIADFGYRRDNPWTTHTLYCKRESGKAKDPTFKGIGVGGAITGGHFDLIICDDIVDDDNARTEHQRQILSEWFTGTIKPLLEPWGQIIVICTRKHFRDLYGDLLENSTWWHPMCRIDVEQNHQRCGYRAIEVEPMYDYILDKNTGKIEDIKIKGDHQVLWPEFQDIERLLFEKATMGTIMFNREYQNDPSGMMDIALREIWLRYWDFVPSKKEDVKQLPPYEDLYIVAAYDLAASTAADAHYFGYVIMGRDKQGRIYLLEADRKRLDFPAQLKLLQDIANRDVPPALHIIEINNYQRSLAQASNWLLDIPVKPVTAKGPKDQRTISITPHLESGRIFIHKSQQDFLEEYRQFPMGKYDDILDAFTMAVTELVAGLEGGLEYIMIDMWGKELT